MPKYKVLVPNKVSIGKFNSEEGILSAVKPNAKETKQLANAVEAGLLKELIAKPKPSTSDI